MSAPTDTLLALAGAVVTTHLAGRVPETPPARRALLYPGAGTPRDRMLDGATPWRTHVYRLLAIANDPEGARVLADLLVSAIDGADWLVVQVSDPLPDSSDPTAPTEWSVTLEIRHHT